MTLPRTWSSASTSRWKPFFLGLGLALLIGGCAAHTRIAPLPPVRGYVDLDALTRRHPGWSGVSQYDAALRRLETAGRSLPPTNRPDQKIATLPALPPALGDSGLPAADAGQIGSRLTSVQRSLVDGLRSRRGMARADQIASRQDGWVREARQQYPVPPEKATLQPDLALQLLQANVETLTRTLDGWKESVPPAPQREALRAKVEADRARLQRLGAARVQARDAERARQEVERQRLREARVAYVQTQADTLNSRLRAGDERFIAGQQARLTRQRTDLLGALVRPAPISVPAAGDAGAQTLPKGPRAVQAALAGKSLAEAEAHLGAQKARWVRHLYDDTRAAAQDTADQRHLDVTFGPPRPGDRDLTPALAQAMREGVWRVGPGSR
jgi:hypothetical protein